jgi:hypothetical protein
MMKRKVLVLYIWAGLGHYREAKAVYDGLRELKIDAELINPLDVLRTSSDFRIKIFVFVNDLSIIMFRYFMSYFTTNQSASDMRVRETWLSRFEMWMLKLYKRWQYFIGDISVGLFDLAEVTDIVSLHPLCTGLSLGFKKKKHLNFKIYNVCPDEATGMTIYFYIYPDAITCVNSKSVYQRFIEQGVEKENLLIIGHTMDPLLYSNRDHIFKRVQGNLKEGNVLTLGLYIGGFAPQSQQNAILGVIEHLQEQIRDEKVIIKVLSNTHNQFHQRLMQRLGRLKLQELVEVTSTTDLKKPVTIGHRWMKDEIDVMFSRPSELVFYSLCTGIPHILFPALGGQEVDMRDLLRQTAGVVDYTEIQDQLWEYIENNDELQQVSHKLFHSRYNLDGVNQLIKHLASR